MAILIESDGTYMTIRKFVSAEDARKEMRAIYDETSIREDMEDLCYCSDFEAQLYTEESAIFLCVWEVESE